MNVSEKLYRCSQVRRIDEAAIASGIAGIVLMKRAGRAAFESIRHRWPDLKSYVIVCGSGNNGGDGFIVAGLALAAGLEVRVFASRSVGLLKGDAALAAKFAVQEGAQIAPIAELSHCLIEKPQETLIVDALLGTGLSGELKVEQSAAIDWMNAQACSRIALDIPSGLDGNSGRAMPTAVNAELTITFIARKVGLYTGSAANYVGEIELADLAIPDSILANETPEAELINDAVRALRVPRLRDAHKNHSGHVAVLGGDLGMGGAALMAAEAALYSGAGLCSLYTHAQHIGPALVRCPELMAVAADDSDAFKEKLSRSSCQVIGPGLGQGEWSKFLLRSALSLNLPRILDADALNLLARGTVRDLVEGFAQVATVLTPHPGEAARLFGCSVAEIQNDRIGAAKALAEQFNACVVLKGAGSVVASAEGVRICAQGNPGMATAGMGDVLAGIIGALLGQGLSAFDAACLGVQAHAVAADVCVKHQGEAGLRATDLYPTLRLYLNNKLADYELPECNTNNI